MDMACAQCKSANIQKLSLVHEGGASAIAATTVGAGIGTGGLGAGIGQTSGTQVTTLSARAAPPQRQAALGQAAYSTLAILIFSLFWHWLLWLLILPPLAVFAAYYYNNHQWPALWDAWDKKYMCLRCGAIMEPHIEPAESLAPNA
jgi:hypothetical protein